MANLEIVTVGAKVVYHHSATMAIPTTSGTVLHHVNTAPGFELEPDTIDVSDTEDYITRYRLGRQDPGGDAAFVMNHTDETISEWATMCNGITSSLPYLIFEYWFPDAAKSYFWVGDPAETLGTSGIDQNSLSTIPAHVAPVKQLGWGNKTTVS